MKEKIADHIKPGDHGTTFGGGPLVTHVALEILKRIAKKSFLQSVNEKSQYLFDKLKVLQKQFPEIISVRGKGLMVGIELDFAPQELIKSCADNGLLICKTAGNAVRFLPPLIVEKNQIDEALNKFEKALTYVRENHG